MAKLFIILPVYLVGYLKYTKFSRFILDIVNWLLYIRYCPKTTHAWACGGMVDTLVLGTSAKAWEFESLHAHHFKKNLV